MREIKFRAYDKKRKQMRQYVQKICFFTKDDGSIGVNHLELGKPPIGHVLTLDVLGDEFELMQFTGLLDKNGKEIYEGDIIGEESVYHFIDREGWEPSSGKWKIIGEKKKNFTGKEEERYISGYELKLVEWRNNGFEPFCDSDENCGHCGGGRRPTDFEIIGNTYENPELLT